MTTGTLKDRVYAAVLLDIINGQLTCDSVINEKTLAEKLQVSKAPVREALVSLCSNGILQSVPRQGYRIVRYTRDNLRDILDYRVMLELGCLERSFERITPTQLRRLESIVEGELLFLADEDPRNYWTKTLNFHLTLASFADNEFVYRRLDEALNTTMRAYLQLCWSKWQEAQLPALSSLHLQITEAIRKKDRAEALMLLERDIRTLDAPVPLEFLSAQGA